MTDTKHGPRVGADPEIFVKTVSGGLVVPICGKIGGTKEKPIDITDKVDARFGAPAIRARPGVVLAIGGYAVQEDNVMLEFNVPAAQDYAHFVDNIVKAISIIDGDFLQPAGLEPHIETMHSFKHEELEKHTQAFTIGCLPDYYAYAEGDNFKRDPFDASVLGNLRFCGGHLHINYNKNNVPEHVFAQLMDLAVALPAIRWDKQRARRQFYGLPGLYRPKSYGIEYRTLSNFWLKSRFRDKWLGHMMQTVFNLAYYANKNPETLQEIYSSVDWEDVQKAVLSENVELADKVLNHVRSIPNTFLTSGIIPH